MAPEQAIDEELNDQHESLQQQSPSEIANQIRAAQRLLHTREAQSDLIKFTMAMMPHRDDEEDITRSQYSPQKHHRCIAAALEQVQKGTWRRLIITLPPGAGKTELASKAMIPWCLGKNPHWAIIFATYNETYSEDIGRAVRDRLKEPAYRQIFPECILKSGSQAAGRLETTEGGMAAFAGAGGTITGKRADLLLIDDPVKGDEDADSPAFRNKQWSWFNKVAMTRLRDFTSRVVIIMTRWHEDDLVGRLTDPSNDFYSNEIAAKWKVLSLPALAREDDPLGRAPGESIWPDRFPVEYLNEHKTQDKRAFSALFQCTPTPEEGIFFQKDDLIGYQPKDLPKNLRVYAASDHAISQKQDRDKTCMGCAGVDDNDEIWILPDVIWRQMDADAQVDGIISLARKNKPLYWWAENGHITQALGPFLRKRMREEKVYINIIEKNPAKDKKTRAHAIQARTAMRMVHFPKFMPWWAEAENELLKFPLSGHDDFVDFLSWLGIGLDIQTTPGVGGKNKKQIPREGSLGWIKEAHKEEQKKKRSALRGGY